MAKKKEVVINNEEVVEAMADEILEIKDAAAEEPAEKTRLDYVMDVLNDERVNNNEVTCIWNGIEIKIKKRLSIFEMKVLFDNIYERCFSNEDGSYQPEYRDFADRASVVAMYTDLEMPQLVQDQYDLVFMTDLYYFVGDNIDQMQFASIMDAVDEKVKESVDSKTSEIEDTLSTVANLTEMFSTLFDGIDPKEASAVLKTIAENGIDEKAIVDAVINK